MLDYTNFSLNYIFKNSKFYAVVLDNIVFSLSPYRIDSRIKPVPFRRAYFLNRIISADIFPRFEISLFVGSVGIDQLSVPVQSVNRSRKACIALWIAVLGILFYYLGGKFLRAFLNVFETVASAVKVAVWSAGTTYLTGTFFSEMV